jgi:hypothetical protein
MRLILVFGLCIGLTGAARADVNLSGNTVVVDYVWPNVSSIYQTLGTILVTPSPQTVTFQPYFNVSVSGTQIIVDGSNYSGVYSGSFNGEFVVDNSVATFPSVSVDPSSVLTGGAPDIAIAGDTLEISFAGRTFLPGEQLVLDVGQATPEPSEFCLLGISLGALFLLARRRRTA